METFEDSAAAGKLNGVANVYFFKTAVSLTEMITELRFGYFVATSGYHVEDCLVH